MATKTEAKVEIYPLSLNGDTFNGMKSDFDQLLRSLLTKMEESESEDATITVKVSVKLAPDQVNCGGNMRDIIKPSFKHDISTVLQVKNKKSGNVGGNMEMVWDPKGHQYIMRPIDNGQASFFDDEEVEDVAEGAAELPAAEPLQLPAPEVLEDDDYAVIDADIVDADVQQDESQEDLKVEGTKFEWLGRFAGHKLSVMEQEGQIVAKSETGISVFSTGVPETDCRWIQRESIEGYVGDTLDVDAHYDGDPFNPGEIICISVWAEGAGQDIAEFDKPVPAQPDDYQYEDPQEE